MINRKLSDNKIEKGAKRLEKMEKIERPFKSPIIVNKLEYQSLEKNKLQ